jgi:fatty-acyl-CoA synthase
MKSFKELLLWTEAGYGDKLAVIDLERDARWTFADLNKAARSVCAAYAASGVRQNDRIGWLALTPSADITAVSIGARKAGIIPVVMNARASPERIAWMINNVGIKTMTYSGDAAALMQRVQEIGIPSVTQFIAMDEAYDPSHATLAEIYKDYADAPEPDVAIASDDIALIIYTSGSTGKPKPVMHSEEVYIEVTLNTAYMWELTHDDRLLNIMPPNFAGWVGATLAPMRVAASQVCLRFDPERVARTIGEEGPTHALLSPTMLRMLREQYDRDPALFANSKLRAGMLGGEAITPDILQILWRMFPDFQLVGSLGATEGGVAHTGMGAEKVKTDDGKLVGRPMPGVFIELRDIDTGEVIKGPGTGELFVRGAIAKGIWGDETATAENFPGGWWRSKDLLTRAADGDLYFAGRADNVFKSGGIKVSCEDVETVLKGHPSVLDAVVVPVPDAKLGSVAHAFIRHRGALDGAMLSDWWRAQSDSDAFARPRSWTMMGEEPFPMVTAAKVDRTGLRARARELLQLAS